MSGHALTDAELAQMQAADVVLLGEMHDNPHHHRQQAKLISKLRPGAIVFEMLTTDQAERVTADVVGDSAALSEILQWSQTGWPDFAMYYPLIANGTGAVVVGAAVPREAARQAMETGVAATFGAQADEYGLTQALSEADQAEREAFQMAAHCDALPGEMLPMMVDVQRLRDANLARAAVQALQSGHRPVVIVTGNGHARRDGGVPVYLHNADPDVRVFSLGQSEEGHLTGVFDAVSDSATIERPDPCDAFGKSE